NLQAALTLLEEKYRADRQKLRELELEAGELAIKERLHQFAGDLHDGDSCPVCGWLSHPEGYTADNIRESKGVLAERKKILEQSIEKNQMLATNIGKLNQQLQFCIREINDQIAKRNLLLQNLNAHNSKVTWDKYKSIEELDEAFRQADL